MRLRPRRAAFQVLSTAIFSLFSWVKGCLARFSATGPMIGCYRGFMDLLTPAYPASNADCYAVFAQKDLRFDGSLFLGVSTTGIFCRPGCPARLPKFENCSFHETAAGAMAAGYRACKRCHPTGRETALIKTLIALVEETPELKITQAALL